MDKIIDDITTTIEEAIADFQKKIPGIQDRAFDELQGLIKDLKTKNGKILATVDNLKLIRFISNKLGKVIADKDYLEAVGKFVKAFDAVQSLHNEYFAAFNNKFKPGETLDIIKQLSVDATLNSLLDGGLSDNILGPVSKILQQNITTGGEYAELNNKLRDHIRTDSKMDGSLERYTKQITVDAVNQFSGQYHATIASDLGLQWGRYVGSNRETSREFCILLTAKDYVHKSELPEILKGHIDGKNCKLSKSTGLPLGMIPGTTPSNFQVNRGGYVCYHQFYFVPDSSVPKMLRDKFNKVG